MTDIYVSITKPNTKKYPLHQHSNWEIMYYLSGNGYLATENNKIPFKPGTIIIVPPNVMHGSISENDFINISVGGKFNHLFQFNEIVVQQDNTDFDGERLAKLIYENRYSDENYLFALCNAYVHFLLKNFQFKNQTNRVVNKIIEEILKDFHDVSFNITNLLNNSGYSEDYIRAQFKIFTAMTPIDFLTKVRIEHAQKLFEIYANTHSVLEISEACGFSDPIYFSKRFKQLIGISPNEYKKRFIKTAR